MNGLFKMMLIAILAVAVWSYMAWDYYYSHWTVEPAANGKWRSCMEQRHAKGCGSPMSLDEAQWWTETKGGTVIP